jgi:hypothetical protein
MMKMFGVWAFCALLLVTVSCVRPQKYIDMAIQCQQFRQDEAATAVYNEATLLLKSYRACLETYEQVPPRAREYCGEYGKALRNIGLQIKESLDTEPSTKETVRIPPKPK